MAAYFLMKDGGTSPYMKVLKLMYLADRRYMQLYNDSITGDRAVSMPHGPVLTRVYELMNGSATDLHWAGWIAPNGRYDLRVVEGHTPEELDEIQGAEFHVLDEIYNAFGHLNQYQLRDFTHENCGEWTDPHGSSYPISAQEVFLALGSGEEEAKARASLFNERRALDEALARYR
ncbi:Panacea domain-containing protein [Dyella thiooxydans]|uniref:Panacea domain-containing protein n=1 Tax=Dyella thiooxydans TaxID=445710 RepID=UPI0007C4FBEE|nr:Panacea domain-containing protein [Dyella thiooxydans]